MSTPFPGKPGWRAANSLWVIPTLICCGLLTWTSFLYIGVRTRRRVWIISAAVYFAAAVGMIVLMALSGPTDDELATGKTPPRTHTQQTISDWSGGYIIALWFGGVVHALLARPHYLHTLYGRTQQPVQAPMYPNQIHQPQPQPHEWLTGSPQQYWGPTTSQPLPEAAPGTGELPPNPANQYGGPWPGNPWSAPQAQSGNAWPAPRAQAADAWAAPAEKATAGTPFVDRDAPTQRRVDLPAPPDFATPPADAATPTPAASFAPGSTRRIAVNTASAQELSALGLPNDTVTAVLTTRDRNGGIPDIAAFASAAGLKPHELHRFADRLDFSGAPAPAPVRAAARKLDL